MSDDPCTLQRRPSRSRRAAAAFAIATSLAVALPPSAAQAKPPASALERFDAAQKLFDQGKHADALAMFQSVYEETKSPNARLMAARCLLALGRTAEGYEELHATVREAGAKAQSEPKYARTRDAAAAELGVLEAKVGKIVIALADAGNDGGRPPMPPGAAAAKVSLNGSDLAAERLGVPFAVAPGKIVVVATKPDGSSTKREETISAGETKTITLIFAAAPVAVAAPPPPLVVAPPDEGSSKTGGGVRVAGIVLTSIGAVGLGVFGGTYSVAQSKYDSLVMACGTKRCTNPMYGQVVDTGKSMELVSNVSLVAGIATIVAGVPMIIFGGPKAKPHGDASAWSTTSVAVSPYGAQIRYVAAF